MFFLSSILIGISLSLDCFAISISQGLRKNLNPIKAILILSFLFAFFQSGMLLIGYFAGSYSTGHLGSLATWEFHNPISFA
jgi:putative Mn2+ efflux pump MntP